MVHFPIVPLLLIGLVAGAADVAPMIKMKLDRYSILSAFIFHLIAPSILFAVNPALPVWARGGVVYLLLALPVAILAAREEPKSAPIMLITSIVIGTIVAFVQTLL